MNNFTILTKEQCISDRKLSFFKKRGPKASLTGNKKIHPKGGIVIYITSEQLSQLYLDESETKGRLR